MSDTLNVVICGVKGQGVNSTAKIIAYSAALSGYDCKLLPYGENKAGSSSAVVVKYGERVYSSQISRGEADVIIALEKMECARWTPYLRIGGTIFSSETTIDKEKYDNYPNDVFDNLAMLGVNITSLDTDIISKMSENSHTTGTSLLGLAYDSLGLTKDVVREAIRKVLNENEATSSIKAFDIAIAMDKNND